MSIQLVSPAFSNGEMLPLDYTADGADRSPPLAWSNIPADAQSLALICDDPDAPSPEPWVHWLIYDLSPQLNELSEGIEPSALPTVPAGAVQGQNSWTRGQTIGYRGPAPPPGHGLHHYHFRLYALDQPLRIGPGADVNALQQAMQGHVLATGELIGTYQR